MTDGLDHHYHLGESTVMLGALRVTLIFIPFFKDMLLSKQNSPRWVAAFCGVTSEANIIANMQVP